MYKTTRLWEVEWAEALAWLTRVRLLYALVTCLGGNESAVLRVRGHLYLGVLETFLRLSDRQVNWTPRELDVCCELERNLSRLRFEVRLTCRSGPTQEVDID